MSVARRHFSLPAGKFKLALGSRTLVMGIINLTRDSFSQDGLFKSGLKRSLVIDRALRLARKMVNDGADIIDIGAESTRPGARPVSVKEELARIVPVVKRISASLKIPVSVDTYKSEVAEAALDSGAVIINNIMGANPDYNKRIAKICAKKAASLVLMHIRGTPNDMQRFTKYRSLIPDIIRYLKKAIECAQEAGLGFKRLIIDPGIGFAKTTQQNLEILNCLGEFRVLKRPILIGTSRKSFIGKVLDVAETERIFGTAASVALAISAGAHIVRVHDVREMAQVARLSDSILNSKILN
ncbi:MAG: dihydropteroate synthase [Candidatus Omnitrophica bacterium]|nr:dihydropteroate synthase [Candidatus Omnitrophota bacterium]